MYLCGCTLQSGRCCGLSQVALPGEVLQDALGLLVGGGCRRRFFTELSCGSALGRTTVEHAVGRLPVVPPMFASCSWAWSQKASRAIAWAIVTMRGCCLPRGGAFSGVPSSGVVPRSLWISLSRTFPCWCPLSRSPCTPPTCPRGEVDGRRLLVRLEQRDHDFLLVHRDYLGFLVEMACCPFLLLGHPSCCHQVLSG